MKIKTEYKVYSGFDLLSKVDPIEHGGVRFDYGGFHAENYIEYPLLAAVKALHNKNIRTCFSSANKKDIQNGCAYIVLDFDSLSDANKIIASTMGELSSQQFHEKVNLLRIDIPVCESTLVGELVFQSNMIARKFKFQKP